MMEPLLSYLDEPGAHVKSERAVAIVMALSAQVFGTIAAALEHDGGTHDHEDAHHLTNLLMNSDGVPPEMLLARITRFLVVETGAHALTNH